MFCVGWKASINWKIDFIEHQIAYDRASSGFSYRPLEVVGCSYSRKPSNNLPYTFSLMSWMIDNRIMCLIYLKNFSARCNVNTFILYFTHMHTKTQTHPENGYGKEMKEKGQIEDKRRMSRLHVGWDKSVHQTVCWSIIEVANWKSEPLSFGERREFHLVQHTALLIDHFQTREEKKRLRSVAR